MLDRIGKPAHRRQVIQCVVEVNSRESAAQFQRTAKSRFGLRPVPFISRLDQCQCAMGQRYRVVDFKRPLRRSLALGMDSAAGLSPYHPLSRWQSANPTCAMACPGASAAACSK